MALTIRCSACGHELPASGHDAGGRTRCPACRTFVEVSSADLLPRTPSSPDAPTRLEPALTSAPNRAASSARVSERVARAADTAIAAEVEAARADPAKRFGPFVLLSELGKGGMGVVYRAWNDRLRRIVALKTILPGEGVGTAAIARFRREAEAAARLRHPNIVSVHEAGEIEGRHYMAMDFVAGSSFDRRLEAGSGKLAFNRALEVVRDVARAVHYAHEQGVVHRDLKPQNILLDAQDRPVVLDFGLAAIRDSGTKLTKTGMSMGTPAYMPPEQANGDRTDARSDIYSLGATLYEVLTGRPPFAGTTDVNLVVAVLTRDPVPPGTINRRASGDLETICLKCLEKDPERRYPTAAALADDLARHLAGEPISARPVGPAGRLWRKAKRNKAVSSVISGAVLLALVGLVLAAVFVARDRARARAEILEKARSTASTKMQALALERGTQAPPDEASARARNDRLLGLGLDAYEAGLGLVELAPRDEGARAMGFESAIALGEVALEAEQWSLASSAFARAEALDIDSDRARKKLDLVGSRRLAVLDERRKTVEATVRAALSGSASYDHDDALFTLVRLGDRTTVRTLSGELETSTRLIKEALRETLLSVKEPTDDEARSGAKPIDGLEAAVDRMLALPAGESVDAEGAKLVVLAKQRLLAREIARRAAGSEPPSAEAILADAQTRKLSDRLELTKLACEALGRIGIREGAARALGEYLWFEANELRAIVAAVALTQLKDEQAERIIRTCLPFFTSPTFYSAAVRALGRAGLRTAKEARTAQEFLDRACLENDLGDRQGGLADLNRAIELEPSSHRAFFLRGDARREAGDLDGAIADYTRAQELGSTDPLAWVHRGLARLQKSDFEGTIADETLALERDPRSAVAFTNRAIAREYLRELDLANRDYDRALEIDPNLAFAWTGRGRVLLLLGRTDEALANLSRAIELDPRAAHSWIDRGRARAKAGDRIGAIADLSRFLELSKDAELNETVKGELEKLR